MVQPAQTNYELINNLSLWANIHPSHTMHVELRTHAQGEGVHVPSVNRELPSLFLSQSDTQLNGKTFICVGSTNIKKMVCCHSI